MTSINWLWGKVRICFFIGPKTSDIEKYKQIFIKPAENCGGDFYLALLQLQSEWKTSPEKKDTII